VRETRQIRIPPTLVATYKDQDFVKCSFCGVEAKYVTSEKIDWPKKKSFEIAETAIYWKTENSFPEGGSGVYHEIHACPDCFQNKVIPVLEKYALPDGTKFQEKEWEW
jgi:hypothetical protein